MPHSKLTFFVELGEPREHSAISGHISFDSTLRQISCLSIFGRKNFAFYIQGTFVLISRMARNNAHMKRTPLVFNFTSQMFPSSTSEYHPNLTNVCFVILTINPNDACFTFPSFIPTEDVILVGTSNNPIQ